MAHPLKENRLRKILVDKPDLESHFSTEQKLWIWVGMGEAGGHMGSKVLQNNNSVLEVLGEEGLGNHLVL